MTAPPPNVNSNFKPEEKERNWFFISLILSKKYYQNLYLFVPYDQSLFYDRKSNPCRKSLHKKINNYVSLKFQFLLLPAHFFIPPRTQQKQTTKTQILIINAPFQENFLFQRLQQEHIEPNCIEVCTDWVYRSIVSVTNPENNIIENVAELHCQLFS